MKPIQNSEEDYTIRVGDKVVAIRNGLNANRRRETSERIRSQREQGTSFEYLCGDTGIVEVISRFGSRGLLDLDIKANDGRHYIGAIGNNWEKIT